MSTGLGDPEVTGRRARAGIQALDLRGGKWGRRGHPREGEWGRSLGRRGRRSRATPGPPPIPAAPGAEPWRSSSSQLGTGVPPLGLLSEWCWRGPGHPGLKGHPRGPPSPPALPSPTQSGLLCGGKEMSPRSRGGAKWGASPCSKSARTQERSRGSPQAVGGEREEGASSHSPHLPSRPRALHIPPPIGVSCPCGELRTRCDPVCCLF